MAKSIIWTLPSRLIHWMLAAAIVISWLLGEQDEFINFHAAFGAMAGTLIIFRIIWGFIGPKYSKFKDFPLCFTNIIKYLRNPKEQHLKYAGHNPLASWVMSGILVIGLITVATGFAAYSAQGNGPFASILPDAEAKEIKETHELFITILIPLILLHLLGLLCDFLRFRSVGTVWSMFTGTKNIEAEPARLNFLQKVIISAGLLSSIIIFYIVLNSPVKQDGDKEDAEHHNIEMIDHSRD